MARIAKSLDVLRSEINQAHPDRSKLSDGWAASAAHSLQNPTSDHEPNAAGVVNALDVTHDPVHGVDTWAMAEVLRVNRDPRVKYVISNGRAFVGNHGTWNGRNVGAWTWFKYTGQNSHAKHIHVSVLKDRADEGGEWNLSLPVGTGKLTPRPPETSPNGISADMRRRMAKAIIDFEARRNTMTGKLAVYPLPANDGGGTYEVAGINDRYHPEQAAKLKALIEAGRHDEAEASVADYLVNYTKAAAGWTEHAGVEFYLRDSIFNRGPKGAARILQRGLGIEDDGEVGPTTRAAMAKLTPDAILTKLRAGRENYERQVVGFRANFWKGLNNRWDKALVKARAFQREQGTAGLDTAVTTGVIVVGTGTVAAIDKSAWTWTDIGMAAFSVGVAALVVFFIIRSMRRA